MTIHLSQIAQYLTSWRVDIWIELILLILILITFVVTLLCYLSYRKFQIENSTFSAIESLYDLFHRLSIDYNDWRFSHLFCITEKSYRNTCAKIEATFSVSGSHDELKVALLEHQLREENLVINILLFYEQVYFQHKHSKNLTLRKEFLRLIDRYFKERLLLNPRIIHFLMDSRCGRELHLEEESMLSLADRYETALQEGHFDLYMDSQGPFHLDKYTNTPLVADHVKIDLETFRKWRKLKEGYN